jgi:hypothetical protein
MAIEKIRVLAKTYPEISSKHGPLVCVAGINEYREWRRLYPIPLKIWINEEYKDVRFKKWDIIEVEVSEKPPPHDRRFESRQVINWKNIRIVNHIEDWGIKLGIVKELLDPDIESIANSGRSLGVIKPTRILDFFSKPRNKLRDEAEKEVLKKMDKVDSTVTLLEYLQINNKHLLPEVKEPDVKVEELPWIGYKFYCSNPRCRGHEMMVIDWEAQELFRKYKTVEGPVKQKLFNELVSKRDLYFIVGNTWKYHKSFMIIGLFYPPKEIAPVKPLTPIFKDKPKQRTLFDTLQQK